MALGALIAGAVGTIVAAAVSVTKALAVAGLAIQGLKAIGAVFTALCKALGLIKPETEVEDLGDKALQAEQDGIVPENFDSYEEYMKTVEDYETDPERSKQISQEDKMRKGLELISGVMIEKFKDFPMSDLLVSMGKNIDFFTPEKVGEIAGVIMKEPNVIGDLSGYLSGTEKNDAKLESAIDTLTSVTKMVEPEKNDVEILRDIAALRK